ncbi:MAG: squalene--hopene cyclase [Planctomycetia bacterium]|nr:squalene--hopene cyclase [Planctomycetia bacterium]
MVDPDRLSAAYETARCDLLAESAAAGHWIGELSSSALSTATAISALALAERHAPTIAGRFADEKRECRLSELIMASVRWLAKHQNSDGGWGDTDKSLSNIATTMLVRSAFALTAVPADCPGLLERADAYISAQGGIAGLRRRYGKDKTFAVPILTNCALAGLIPWRKVPALPFELACFSQNVWKFLRLPVVSYAIPALVAIGQARYFHRKPWNPITRLLRRAAVGKSLRVLETLQPKSGGFLEATPLTSFVVMSLASIGRTDHPVVRKGVEFLLASVRPDGSWPIDTNLATWNTTLAVSALASAGEDVRELGCLDWVLACQHREVHPYTGAEPGGWAWTDLSGGVPDVDDTSGALLALAAWSKADPDADSEKLQSAAAAGVKWLLDLQNSDGGWPTFCRGWGKLPFDRSGADLTAHALRALHAWRTSLAKVSVHARELSTLLDQRMGAAMERGFRYLIKHQHADGFWQPLWFGNQHRPEEDNPIYGTAKVLAAFRDFGRLDCPAVHDALEWLMTMKHADGSWGGEAGCDAATARRQASVEETALAAEALLTCGKLKAYETAALQGVKWLIDAVEANRHQESSPIGFYFAKLWYYEKLYPLISTVAALGQAARRLLPQPEPPSVVHLGKP